MNKVLSAAESYVFSAPKLFLGVILALTAFFAFRLPSLEIYTDFADLLPQGHPYIQLHNEIRDTFGGANGIIISVEVDEGTIFNDETLARIHRLTQAADSLPSVNHNLVSSITHRTARNVWLSDTGDIKSEPFYDPLKEDYTETELEKMLRDVTANPSIYGLLVSPDLKAALIKAQLNEGAIDYQAVFEQLQAARQDEAADGVSIYATGHPVLVGWVYSYLGQIMQIFLLTAATMVVLLIVYFRRAYGVFVPLAGILISSTWGLGFVSLLGYNLDPLTLVVPFLIAARGLSHGIQIVERYYHELPSARSGRDAAQRTFESLFRPGSLGVISDGVGILLIALGSIPINTKLAFYGSLWALSVIVSVLVVVPLILSLLPAPKSTAEKSNIFSGLVEKYAAFLVGGRASGRFLWAALALVVLGAGLSSRVQIGESEPGSPLLYRDHDFNISSKAVNDKFPGSEELYIIAHTDEKGGLKRPEVLHAIAGLQRHMMLDPSLGGAKALPDVVVRVNRLLHNNDPRWMRIPEEPAYTGGLMFAYMASSPVPGALKEFANPEETDANIVLFYKDHKGATIRRATTMLKDWINNPENQVDGLEFRLAGGIVGVTAAGNEAAFQTNLIVIPSVFLLIYVFVTSFYRSFQAGGVMLMAMVFATTLSYAYMGIVGIGINVNTVPIIAIGVGVGIDYSIYMMDRIREEYASCKDIRSAVAAALGTTGQAICFTALTLMSGVVMWVFLSDMRFQADAAKLLIVMLMFNAIAALALVPAWVLTFKPKFITVSNKEERKGARTVGLKDATA